MHLISKFHIERKKNKVKMVCYHFCNKRKSEHIHINIFKGKHKIVNTETKVIGCLLEMVENKVIVEGLISSKFTFQFIFYF